MVSYFEFKRKKIRILQVRFMANEKKNDSDKESDPTIRMTEEEIENLDLENDKVKELMEQYKEETGKFAIWRIPAKYLITRGFKRWLKGEKTYLDKERISLHEKTKAKEIKSRVEEEDRIFLKRIISGKDIFMSIPQGKDITKPEGLHYDILLVEDDIATIRLLLSYFISKGHTIVAVTTGHNIIEKVKSFQPKVILTDILHPGPSGLEICRQIKSTKEFKQIPIFFQTAQSGISVEKYVDQTSADGYILKPFKFSDFDGILDLLKK
ncbi:MAG: response regulator [Promethearchaeota archaeon]|nr:MAG: response regulator [Candidatus Lokiarchaeota archaeon]